MTQHEVGADAPSDARPTISVGRKLMYAGGTLALLVLVWVLALEAAIRIFDIGPEINPVWRGNYQLSENPVLRYALAPGSADGTSKINRHGMRDRDYALTKPAGVFRIAVIGDSISFGLSVAQSAAFSAKLESLLENHFRESGEPNVEILNFGVTGYSFLQVMETLRTRVVDFDPDLVVYAYALNDPQEYSLEMDNLLAQLTEAEERYLNLDEPENYLSRSRLVRLVRYLISKETSARRDAPVWNRDDPQFLALRQGRFAEYFAQIHSADDTWRPIALGLDELAAFSAAKELPVHALIFPLFTEFDPYPIPEVHAQLREAFARRSIPVLDLLDTYACYAHTGQKPIKSDALHPNQRGHVIAAVALLHHLLATDSLPGLSMDTFDRLAASAPKLADYTRLTKQIASSSRAEMCRRGSVVPRDES